MPTNLLEIKEILSSWYALTINNPLYFAAIAVVIWLLAVVLYNIKILFLKKKQTASDATNTELKNQLEEAQQQLKRLEEQLSANTEQQAKEQQASTELVAAVGERNQKIVEDIKVVAKQFDLSEQLVASDKDMKTEFIWQQQDNIQMQLRERLAVEQQERATLLATHQQEVAQLTEKESLIGTLQTTLDMQTKQFAQLEQSFETQKTLQQQQQQDVQEQLTRTLAKHQVDFAQLIGDINTSAPVVVTSTVQEDEAIADLVSQGDAAKIGEEERIEAEMLEKVEDKVSAPLEDLEGVIEPAVELDNEPEIIAASADIEPAIEPLAEKPEPRVEPIQKIEEFKVETATMEVSEVEAAVSLKPDYAPSSVNMAGKFKKLFGKKKKEVVQAEVEPAQKIEEFKEDVVNSVESVLEGADNTASKVKVRGTFKKLFGKGKKQATKAEPIQKVEELKAEVVSFAESKMEAAAEVKADYSAPSRKASAKVKNLFGKAKTSVSDVEPIQKIEEFKVESTSEAEPESTEVEPDYYSSNMKVPGAIKRLFGKFIK